LKQLKTLNYNKIKLNINNKLYTKKIFNSKFKNLKKNYKNFDKTLVNNIDYIKFDFNIIEDLKHNIFYTSHYSDNLNDLYYKGKFNQFESYISTIELFDFSLNIKNFEFKYKYSLLTKIIPFLIKNGKKLKTINNFLMSMSNIYRSLNNNNLLKEYLFINEFKYYILTTKNTNNLNFILNWIVTIYKPVFDIKAFNVPKVSKKKSDVLMIFKVVYLPDKNRLKVAFKHISLDIKKNNSNELHNRISNSLLDILLNYKKSYLYSRKMYIYEQVMEL